MNKYKRAILITTVLNALFSANLYCAKFSSESFADINGGIAYGVKHTFSSVYENLLTIETAAISTNTASSFMGRGGLFAVHPQPSAIHDLKAIIVSSYSISLDWTAPKANFYNGTGNVSRYMIRYSDVEPVISDNGYANASVYSQNWIPLELDAGETKIIEGFNPATTYYFVIESLNEHLVSSELSNVGYVVALAPLAPMNLKIESLGNSVSLSWLNPAGFDTNIDFNDRSNPVYPYEIMGYKLFRATVPANGDWSFVAQSSSYTLSWTDIPPSNSEYFYHVKAFNKAGVSEPSFVRGNILKNLYFVSQDKTSMIEVPNAAIGPFVGDSSDQMNFYTINISSHPEDVTGRILNSVEFSAYKGGLIKQDAFKLSDKASITMYYKKSGGEIVPSSAVPDRKKISLYFFNGAKWLQLYGNVDEANQRIFLETTTLGRYQIRAVERLGSFAADFSGLSNRMVTPNGDGKNDKMVFVFDNPRGSSITGKIFDIKGALVSKMTEGEIENSLIWDAKSNGNTVTGGVYIYQVECEGRIYNGTIVVIR